MFCDRRQWNDVYHARRQTHGREWRWYVRQWAVDDGQRRHALRER